MRIKPFSENPAKPVGKRVRLPIPGHIIESSSTLPEVIQPADCDVVGFVGYTAQASRQQANDLHGIATHIPSMLAFEQLFGGPAPAHCTLTLDQETGLAQATQVEAAHFYFYQAMQMFFANGGKQCVVVSVGDYSAQSPQLAALLSGLHTLSATNIALLVIPEACSLNAADYQQLTTAMLNQCASLGNRFAILDVASAQCSVEGDLKSACTLFKSQPYPEQARKFAAAYTPSLRTSLTHHIRAEHTVVQLRKGMVASGQTTLAALESQQPVLAQACMHAVSQLPLYLPPSAAVAGAYISSQLQHGVWKAPANLSLNAVIAPSLTISDALHEWLANDGNSQIAINPIRNFSGRGNLIWGARTLAGNDAEWRYIPVRRLAIFIEQSLRQTLQALVFAPNVASTWARVQASVALFMNSLWRQGALQGAKPETAFFVKVGLGQTMTEQDVIDGLLRLQIGFAALKPAEFNMITLQFQLAR